MIVVVGRLMVVVAVDWSIYDNHTELIAGQDYKERNASIVMMKHFAQEDEVKIIEIKNKKIMIN